MARDFTKTGLAAFSRMVAMAASTPGAKQVLFTLIDGTTYDPDTGTNTLVSSTITKTGFVDRSKDDETKTGGEVNVTLRLSLPNQGFPRAPDIQDEAVIEGVKYKVSGCEIDAMGVQMYVDFTRA